MGRRLNRRLVRSDETVVVSATSKRSDRCDSTCGNRTFTGGAFGFSAGAGLESECRALGRT